MQRKVEQDKGMIKTEVNDIVARAVGAANGGDSSPSFLVRNSDNVNAQLHRAKGLLTMWDFLEVKRRIGTTTILLSRKENPMEIAIIPAKNRSRYFAEGRLSMSYRLRKRLGKFEKVPGLMQTLTYNPKKISKQEAWGSYGGDTRRFLNAIKQYRKRRGWKGLHYFWVVEVQKETGYPHVHIFFPRLRWLAPLNIINGNWRHGRANIESPKKININCAAYISKYLRKMKGWSDLHLALLWAGRNRMYGFSRGFSVKNLSKVSEWNGFGIVNGDDIGKLKKILEGGGFTISANNKPQERG